MTDRYKTQIKIREPFLFSTGFLQAEAVFKDGGRKLQKYHVTMTYVGDPDIGRW